jgi:AraC-like DNA-binding protein
MCEATAADQAAVGFPSLSSFSLAFKRAVGVSPRRWGWMAGTKTAEEIFRN